MGKEKHKKEGVGEEGGQERGREGKGGRRERKEGVQLQEGERGNGRG